METKENKLVTFIKSYHTDNFTWHDFILIPFIIAYILIEAGSYLGVLILYPIFSNIINESNAAFISITMMYLAFIGIWIITLLYCLTKYNKPIYKALLKGVKGNTVKMLLFGFLIGFVTNGLCILIAVLHGDIHIYYDAIHPFHLIVLLISVFIQSSAEELVCRGFLYQRIIKGYKNPAVAIIVNAAFFGILHINNPGVTPMAIASIIIVGLSYSLFVYYCDSIWLPMAAHCAWNYTQNIIFGLPNSGLVSDYSIFKLDAVSATNSFAYDTGFGVEATVVSISIDIILCIILIVWGTKNKKKPTNVWTD